MERFCGYIAHPQAAIIPRSPTNLRALAPKVNAVSSGLGINSSEVIRNCRLSHLHLPTLNVNSSRPPPPMRINNVLVVALDDKHLRAYCNSYWVVRRLDILLMEHLGLI
jgi:hypothetical protein